MNRRHLSQSRLPASSLGAIRPLAVLRPIKGNLPLPIVVYAG
jgi:hypothetical protein